MPGKDGGSDKSDWVPPHFKTMFLDSKLQQIIAVMVHLPSGITTTNNIIVKVEGDGRRLRVKIALPKAVSDPNRFCRFLAFLNDVDEFVKSDLNIRKNAFHDTMSKNRPGIGAIEWKDFSLCLDFEVQEDIPLVKMAVLDGCYYLYIEMLMRRKKDYLTNEGRLSGDVVDGGKTEYEDFN